MSCEFLDRADASMPFSAAFRHIAAALLVAILVRDFCQAQQPAPEKSLTPEQQERLKERDRCSKELEKLLADGKLTEAVAAVEKKLAIEREVLGNDDWEVATSLERLAEIQELQQDFAAARKTCQELLAIATKRAEKAPWQMTDARLALDKVSLLEKLGPQQRSQLADADRLGYQVDALIGQRRYRQAIPLALRGMELRKAVLEPAHPMLARSFHVISFLNNCSGQSAEAEPWARKAVEVGRQVYGANHPDYATSLSNLAFCCDGLGNTAEAVSLYRQTAEVRQRALGATAEMTRRAWNTLALELDNFAESLIRHRDLASARPVREESLRIRTELYGAANWQAADSRRDLDDLTQLEKLDPRERAQLVEADDMNQQVGELLNSGKFKEALAPAQQALETRRRLLGEMHPAYATSLHNLAMTNSELVLCQSLILG